MVGFRGGKASGYGDFYLGPGANFAWQHHARWRSTNEISLFDNGYEPSMEEESEKFSRAIRLSIDISKPGNYTVSLIQELLDPERPTASTQGSLQYLPNGNFWVGYGEVPLFVEFNPDGKVICRFSQPGSSVGSYRAYKYNLTTNPSSAPDIAVKDDLVYMSWNGATRVVWWDVFFGYEKDYFPLRWRVKKTGFETNHTLPVADGTTAYFTKVEAVDAGGNALKSSGVVRVDRSTGVESTVQRILEGH